MGSLDRRHFLKTTAAGLASLSAKRATPLPSDEDPLGVRGDFPITETGTVYLNSAGVTPMPVPVKEAALEYLENKTLRPTGEWNNEKQDQARQRFAELFGVRKDEVALLYSTSDGENIAARGLEMTGGDNIVVDELHFTTAFVLYRQIEKERGVELRIVPHRNGEARLEDFETRVDERTKLVSVAWVSNRNGFRHDLRALSDLAHRRGALLYADGIQALGNFPTNLSEEGVDVLCSGSYKWLLASYGVAPFYVREEHLDRIHPDRYGHRSVRKELPGFHYELKSTALKYVYSNPANGAVYQLAASLPYLGKVGLDRIEKHTLGLARELRDGIVNLGFEPFTPRGNPSPIVSFEHGRDPEEMAKRLEKEGIVVTLREGGKLLRAGIALFNNRNDILTLLRVLENIA